ncbi:hypothetical protein ACN47E_001717 [Coniothyrium glycines]
MTECTPRGSDGPTSQPQSQRSTAVSTTVPAGVIPSNSHRGIAAARGSRASRLQTEAGTDRATAAFIRRTLCGHYVLLGNGEKAGTTLRPIEEALPPLTSSNQVDLQLYAIISVIIKEFVQTWYSKITPDHIFVNEILQIIAHCTRGLEQRLRKIDLEALLLDEIPEVLHNHLSTYRLAQQQAISTTLALNPRVVYHTLHPHPALSPVPSELEPTTVVEQRESESAWRQLLVQGVLAILLPTEDLENGCLRALVAEIFAEMIIGDGISSKACEGWLLWEGITRIAEVLQTDNTNEQDSQPESANPGQSLNRLERFGLLSLHGNDTSVPKSTLAARHGTPSSPFSSGLFWAIVQHALFALTAVRAVFLTIATSSSLPSRSATSEQSSDNFLNQSHMTQADSEAFRRPLGKKRPIVSMKVWSCAAQLVALDVRMPWLLGFISMLHRGVLAGPGRVGDTDGVLDRILSRAIHTRILNPAFVPTALRTVRATLFPNNGLGSPRQIPSNEEAQQIKERCATTLLNLLPPKLAAAVFATGDRALQHHEIWEMLSCLDDAYMNKHFIYQIVELVVLRLIPELGSRSIEDLLEERIN